MVKKAATDWPDIHHLASLHGSLLDALRLDAELTGELPTQHATVIVDHPES